ncbi:hypothetical protein [Rhodopseudomonas sp. B29]|uniref:hypothetical protein n=1 Tax=Rhodopseudomonas sp. B29 TaxID=95607 RepID=UPI0011D27D5F|nr:hypothetical protein [Rhodopseudomonas sp. B29]
MTLVVYLAAESCTLDLTDRAVTSIRRRLDTLTLERIFCRLRTRMGLFIVGAGASAGSSPLGADFWRGPPLDYLRNTGSFPAIVTPRNLLTQRLISYSGIEIEEIFPGRIIHPGTDQYPFRELVERLPDAFAREYLKYSLAQAKYFARRDRFIPDSYLVFRMFYSSVIADYNHDGLAREFCGKAHEIVEMHGKVHANYGLPESGALISSLREFDIPLPPDDLIMGVPESWFDKQLRQKLSWVMGKAPQHVVIIGYSFAQMGSGYDDEVTREFFIQKFRHYPGAILVINPDPTQLCEMLSDELKINTVYPIKQYWNVLAHAYLETLRCKDKFRSLEHAYGFLYDRHGSDQAFLAPMLD